MNKKEKLKIIDTFLRAPGPLIGASYKLTAQDLLNLIDMIIQELEREDKTDG